MDSWKASRRQNVILSMPLGTLRVSAKSCLCSKPSRYYNLILDFRRVEIESQNYFTLVREFDQRTVEYRGGFTSRN